MKGIYKIYNNKTQKVYIGESLNIVERWDLHMYELKNNSHHNFKLQSDYNKYGEDSFEFSVVLALDDSIINTTDSMTIKILLVLYENKYIKNFNSIEEGYNIEDTLSKIITGIKPLKINNEIPVNKSLKAIRNMFKHEFDRVKNGIIVERGGILFRNMYSVKYLSKKYNLSNDALNKLLLSLKIYEFNNRVDSFKFNNDIVPEDRVLKFDGSSTKYLFKEEFNRICSMIESTNIVDGVRDGRDIIEEYRKAKMNRKKNVVINEVPASECTSSDKAPLEPEETLDISIEHTFIEKNNDKNKKSDSFKRFVEENFILNVDYTLILYKMRQLGILKYATYNKKRICIPSKMYEDKFYYVVTSTNNITGGLLIRCHSRKFIANILKENNLISDKI